MLRNKGLVSILAKGGMVLLCAIIFLLFLLPGCTINNTETTTVTSRLTSTVTSTVTTTVKSTITTTVTRDSATTSQIFPTTSTPQSTTTSSSNYTLNEALALGIITIKINGYAGTTFGGVSSGDVVVISFQRQRPEPIHISVPVGTTLVNDDSTEQNMVIQKLKGRDPSVLGYYPATEITLNTDEWQKYLFEAYCLNLSKSNVYSSTSFHIGEPASAEVIAMLTAARSMVPEVATISAIQTALWCLTDNPTLDELNKRFTVNQQTLAGAWSILDRAGLNPGSRILFVGYTPG